MLYSEKIAVCSQIHTKHINTLCGQKAQFLNVRPGGFLSMVINTCSQIHPPPQPFIA
jgi:hypothetical protein